MIRSQENVTVRRAGSARRVRFLQVLVLARCVLQCILQIFNCLTATCTMVSSCSSLLIHVALLASETCFKFYVYDAD